jgi:uncharacterized protein (TIGR02284 family)
LCSYRYNIFYMENLAQSVVALSSLIEMNNKRVKVYRAVAEKTARNELKALFNSYAEQSKSFSSNLSTWRAAYGGFGLSDNIERSGSVWEQLKSILALGHAKDPVRACEEVEQDALKAYRHAVANSFLPTPTVADVQRQTREVEKALARLRALK